MSLLQTLPLLFLTGPSLHAEAALHRKCLGGELVVRWGLLAVIFFQLEAK